jgi:phosphatidate cytidylyltransferase
MSNLVQRGITGLIFVSVLIAAIVLGDWYFSLLFGIIAILSLNEFYSLFKDSAEKPNNSQGLIIGTIIYLLGVYTIYQNDLPTWLLALLILLFPLIGFVELFRKQKVPFQNMGLTLIGLFYIISPFLLINVLRINEDSYWPVLSIFILTWTSDTFAYLIGRKIGKHRLFERISPKKSWEGFIGGMLFSVFAGLIIAYFTEDDFVKYAVYGISIATFGTLGDLVESMLKRSLNIKDSGTILPGHGGLLDRFDAVIFVIPIIYCLETFVFV